MNDSGTNDPVSIRSYKHVIKKYPSNKKREKYTCMTGLMKSEKTVYGILYALEDRVPYALEDRILYIFHMNHKNLKRPYIFREGPYTFRPGPYTFRHGPYSLRRRPYTLRQDRILYVKTVYFQSKTVYFQPGPCTLHGPYTFRTVYFTFQDRIYYLLK